MAGKTLTVYLAADLKKFTGPLSIAKGQLNGFDTSIGGIGKTLSSMLGPALIAAGTAAAAFAVKLGVDGVKAAVEDEAATAKLNQTLSNLGFGEQTEAVNGFIDALARQTGVADDALRPAFDRLIRSTGDLGTAQDALALALDVSAGSGKSLDAVAQALGRAYDGNAAGLSRLGVGLDAATLKSGNMEMITSRLQDRFGGQAATAAATYQGRLDRLSVAFDELKESFGYGFLNGLNSAEDATDDLTDGMQDLEPIMQDIGRQLAIIATGAAKGAKGFFDYNAEVGKTNKLLTGALSIGLIQLADRFGLITDEQGAAEEAAYNLWLQENDLWKAMDDVTRSTAAQSARLSGLAASLISTANAASAANNALRGQSAETDRYTALARLYGATIRSNGGTLNEWRRSLEETDPVIDRVGGSTSSLTTENDRLSKAFEAQQSVVDGLNASLETQVGKWEAAKQAVTDYANNMADRILGGVDLGAAYEGQFDDAGNRTGQTFLAAFDDQLAQAEWFGNVLNEIKRQGADQSLLEQIVSLGPGVGGGLAQQMINEGLVPILNEKWSGVRTTAQTLAASLVPDFLLAGQDYAASMVTGTAAQLLKEQNKLQKIGKSIGQPIGSGIKVEIAEAVAEAVAAAQAAGTAARAEAVAAEERRQAVLTQQAVAQVLAQVVNNANARTGYNSNPVVR